MVTHTVALRVSLVPRLPQVLELALVGARVRHLAVADLLDRVLPVGVPLVARVPHLVLVRVEVVALALSLAHQSLARLRHILHVLLAVFGVALARCVDCVCLRAVPVGTWLACELGPKGVRFEL